MLLGQPFADRRADPVDALPEHVAVRPREVDVLEDTLSVAADRHIAEPRLLMPFSSSFTSSPGLTSRRYSAPIC
jgi:hypothetical protein